MGDFHAGCSLVVTMFRFISFDSITSFIVIKFCVDMPVHALPDNYLLAVIQV